MYTLCYFCSFLTKFEFAQRLLATFLYKTSQKIFKSKPSYSMQKNGQWDITKDYRKLRDAFRKFTNAPEQEVTRFGVSFVKLFYYLSQICHDFLWLQKTCI